MNLFGGIDDQGARSASVTQASPLQVTFDGQSTGLRALCLTSYAPVVGDRVAVTAIDGSRLLVLGKRA